MSYAKLTSQEENVSLLEANGQELYPPRHKTCMVESTRTRGPLLRLLVSPIFLSTIIVCQTIAIVVFLFCNITSERNILYSPGNEAISYKYQRFFVGSKHDRSPFQSPPSPELDERWEDLYHFGISRIPKAQAVKLPNATAAIPGDESHYIAELDVFHQLHCLNIVRKTIYSEHYTDMHISLANNEEHVSHCIESLRQSVMCASDISVIVWQWDQEARKSRVRLDAVHQCRDFDRIREWGLKRQLKEDFNEDIHVESDLKPPPLLY